MQRRYSSPRSWGIALVIALVVTLCATGIAMLLRSGDGTGFGSYQLLQLGTVTHIEAVDNGLIYSNGQRVARIGSDGRSKWSKNVGPDASFTASNRGVAAWSGKKLTLFDESTGDTGYTGSFDSDILSAKVGAIYCAVLLGPEHDSTIMLMEKGGRMVDSLTLNDLLVVDYGFFYDGSLFWVMTLDSNGTAPSCTISVYRPGKRMVGNISDIEQVLYKPIFRQSDIICGGETYLKTYTYNGEEQEADRRLIYGYVIADVYEGSSSPTIVLVPNDEYGGDSGLQDVRVLKGSIDTRIHMAYDCVDFVAGDRKVYGFSADGYVMIGDLELGSSTAYYTGIPCDKVLGITSDGKAVLANGSDVYLLSLV